MAAVICGHDGHGEIWELDDDDDVTGEGECDMAGRRGQNLGEVEFCEEEWSF